MPRKPKAKPPRIRTGLRETVALSLPRPKGTDAMRTGKLPVPRLMVVRGVRLCIYTPRFPKAREVAGWRLYVAVDGAVLLDGVPLTTMLRIYDMHGSAPVRDDAVDVCILTPRDEPVDVHVAVEWHGRGERTRLPEGLEVRVDGDY